MNAGLENAPQSRRTQLPKPSILVHGPHEWFSPEMYENDMINGHRPFQWPSNGLPGGRRGLSTDRSQEVNKPNINTSGLEGGLALTPHTNPSYSDYQLDVDPSTTFHVIPHRGISHSPGPHANSPFSSGTTEDSPDLAPGFHIPPVDLGAHFPSRTLAEQCFVNYTHVASDVPAPQTQDVLQVPTNATTGVHRQISNLSSSKVFRSLAPNNDRSCPQGGPRSLTPEDLGNMCGLGLCSRVWKVPPRVRPQQHTSILLLLRTHAETSS